MEVIAVGVGEEDKTISANVSGLGQEVDPSALEHLVGGIEIVNCSGEMADAGLEHPLLGAITVIGGD
jgi:hypothetical protein